jgi:hypothetical protein
MSFLTPDLDQFLLSAAGTYLFLIGLMSIVILRDQRATLSTRIVVILVLILVKGNRFFNFLVKKE